MMTGMEVLTIVEDVRTTNIATNNPLSAVSTSLWRDLASCVVGEFVVLKVDMKKLPQLTTVREGGGRRRKWGEDA